MTRPELEAFQAILKHGSLTAASGKLFVTQPALSRRIRTLEAELGYELFVRQKGVRAVSLTEAGRAFIPVAEKFFHLYREAGAISNLNRKPVLQLSSVGSVSTYLLPRVLHRFLESKAWNLRFQNDHSIEAYRYAEGGLVDVALVSNVSYSREIRTIPAFQEPFVVVGGEGWDRTDPVHPSRLNPEAEIRLPWNPEFDAWHDRWFDASVYPNVHLDQMSLLEDFLVKDNWALVPLTVAMRLRGRKMCICPIEEGPDDRIIYYLVSGASEEKRMMIDRFLCLLHEELSSIEGVRSFLSAFEDAEARGEG